MTPITDRRQLGSLFLHVRNVG